MTPGMWVWTILAAIVALVGLAFAILAIGGGQTRGERLGYGGLGLVIALIFGSLAFVPHWWQHNTEGGKRSLRNYQQTRHVTESPTRLVHVYSATGELVATYTGKFDVGSNGGWIDLDIHRPDGSIQRVLIKGGAGSVTVEDVAR